jgi:hypothetical protein
MKPNASIKVGNYQHTKNRTFQRPKSPHARETLSHKGKEGILACPFKAPLPLTDKCVSLLS